MWEIKAVEDRRGCTMHCLVQTLRKGRLNCLRHAFQAIRDGDEDVPYAAILQAAEDADPKVCALVFGLPHA